jgi:hypothetical protein
MRVCEREKECVCVRERERDGWTVRITHKSKYKHIDR